MYFFIDLIKIGELIQIKAKVNSVRQTVNCDSIYHNGRNGVSKSFFFQVLLRLDNEPVRLGSARLVLAP
jgi:hypothetical protein